jgi:hypothetical protein
VIRAHVIGLAFVALLAAGGCTKQLGYAGKNPGGISCKGKATVSIQGNANIGAGVGGSATDNGSVTFDCGESGAYIIQGPPEQLLEPNAATPLAPPPTPAKS